MTINSKQKLKFNNINGKPKILLITGNDLRHERFVYKIKIAFPDAEIKWYAVDDTYIKKKEKSNKTCKLKSCIKKVLYKLYLLKIRIIFKDLVTNAIIIEKRMFETEVICMKKNITVKKNLINNPNNSKFIKRIQNKYHFLLTLGGPLYSNELIDSSLIASINQHAGISPSIKGGHSTDWALYFRNLDLIGSTVHLLSSGADTGDILRQQNTALMMDDTPGKIFLRTVALGTDLMINVVDEIITTKEIYRYKQPKHTGYTFRGYDWSINIIKSIHRDFIYGWLKKEIIRKRDF
jgi:folate-dependent phosphoribosylglycinamide formyltransferase PurN